MVNRNPNPDFTWKPKTIIAVDPGTTTGMFQVLVEPDSFTNLLWMQFTTVQVADYLLDLSAMEPNWSTLVMEKFGVGQRTHKASRDGVNDALNLIGWIRLSHKLGTFPNVNLIEQDPAAGKTITDKLLQGIGWYKPGNRHANDAARHVVRFLLNRHYIPMMDLYRKYA